MHGGKYSKLVGRNTGGLTMKTRHRASTRTHVLANILRSRYVARTPPLEARNPGGHSNVENAPVDGQLPARQTRPLPIYGVQF